METLKKVINITAMVYLIVAFLFLLRILSVSKFVALFDLPHDAAFLNRFLWAGAILLLAELLIENAYIATLKRGLEREHRQITELKAQLYDQRMKDSVAAPVVPQPDPTRPVNSTPQNGTFWASADRTIPPTTGPTDESDLPPRPDQRPLP
ncbi:hypothetical protein [Rufibacter roseus]|uniref:DUF1049 domain-containing protein n=1 Tax=Rufibacter roseus TaxID=1567108 RepID=A0ABW2DE75_9BACT|nr:hypothetical protein [Rufibacter roseus]